MTRGVFNRLVALTESPVLRRSGKPNTNKLMPDIGRPYPYLELSPPVEQAITDLSPAVFPTSKAITMRVVMPQVSPRNIKYD